MATTTNYGWTTPDDTALVKDGASAIRTLGSSIDTTTKNLNPSTTLGDIEYRSSTANTNTRLPLGTAGQVLTVNSGATAPEWATSTSGSLTLLSTTAISGVTTTISSISQAYKHLYIVIYGTTNATSDSVLFVRPNSASTACYSSGMKTSTQVVREMSATSIQPTSDSTYLRTSTNNAAQIMIYNYSSTTFFKPFVASSIFLSSGSIVYGTGSSGGYYSNSAVSSLAITNDNATSYSTGTCLIYGVN